LRVVIDTNVFVESISNTSSYHRIFTNFISGKFFVCTSNSILLEYEEVLYSLHRQENVDRFMDLMRISPFVMFISPSFYYNLIYKDPDDNKFVDCAITGQADFIITSDKHFEVLKNVEIPKVNVIHPREFIEKYLSSKSE
jgi:uncharacterized protein